MDISLYCPLQETFSVLQFDMLLLWFVITSEMFLVQFKGVTVSNTYDETFVWNN